MIEVRTATDADMGAVAEIYGHYVLHSHATFEVEPPTVEAWVEAFRLHRAYDFVVADDGGRVIGFAKTGRFRDRRAYDPSVEVSVYCAHDAVGLGAGAAMYAELFARLQARDFHRAYAGIALPNDASIALHERFGFSLAGTFREVGRKFDRWWDVAWYEKALP